MYPNGKEKSTIYTAEGSWSDKFEIKDSNKRIVDSYNAKAMPKTPLTVRPIEQQDPLESRRAWQKVAEAITKGDMDTTSSEKSLIENQQRALRKQEKEENREWERRYFTKKERHELFERLVREIPGGEIDSDKTNGIWFFDAEKARVAPGTSYEY